MRSNRAPYRRSNDCPVTGRATSQIAIQADVVCAANLSGTAIAGATENCTGAGEKIDYAAAPASAASTVTLNAVTISAPSSSAVAIDPGATAQTVVITPGGNITSTAGDGVRLLTPTGAGTLSLGTLANRIASPVTGGNGALAADGIRVEGLGDASVYTGNVAITSTSNAGASWGIRARSLAVGSGLGGAVIVDTQGPVSGPGGIQATTTGTDTTDSVTAIAAGPVTGTAGAGIQVRSVNGNSVVTVSAPVVGSTGTGANGIDVSASGSGNVSVTTLPGGTVTGTGGAAGIVVSSWWGTEVFALNIGADVTSTAGNAIKATNTTANGTNTIAIGAATIRGLGTGATTSVIDMTSASGGLITLTTAPGTAILSNSPSVAAQNGDLAIKGTGGSVTLKNAGALRGTMDFSGISVATNNVIINNASSGSWHTTGTTTFSAGNDVFNNTGLVATNGATTLAFGGGVTSFNNNAGGTFLAAETAGATSTTITGLKTFNNAGTITLVDNETNDVLNAGSTTYVGSGAANISIDAFLGAATQNSCAAPTVSDCVIFGAWSGTGTTITVNDTNVSGAAALNARIVVLQGLSGIGNVTLTGANVAPTPPGTRDPKRLCPVPIGR